jgi:Nickel-dependent hydrogenase
LTLAGSIQIDLFHHAGHANQVQITSTRQGAATRVLLGKTPEQVLNTVPLLFTLCGNAQAYAALLACRAALGMVVAPEIDAAPNWLGCCFESTLLNRQLLGQISANSTLPVQQGSSGGMGLAQVQAARGLLIHRLVLHKGKVYDYRVVAPTEWNFHPKGVVAYSLKRLQADSVNDLQRQAELLINAIDPCVPYQLNLIDSGNGKEIHA